MNADWQARYELARHAARAAGQLALQHFNAGVVVEWKNDASPVTPGDRAAEQLLREQLLQAFPLDGFLGEEFGDTPGQSGYRWIVDPIDGTRGFIRGIPLWGTLVGLEYRGEAIAGVAYAPALGQMWHALRGHGAFRDDTPIRVSDVERLADATLLYSNLKWFAKGGKRDAFLELTQVTQRQRGYGDFYGFVLVAQGSGDVMAEYGVHAWDVAALKPIVEEAGGTMTNWNGQWDVFAPDVLASNGKLHELSRRYFAD
jgi:histidinol-phosphatase